MAWLLINLFDIKIPDYHHARTRATDVRVMVPRMYHADGVLVFCDSADQPMVAVVLEVQRGWDQTKHRTWPLYVAQLQAELDVSVALLAYCTDKAIAGRYRDLFAFDGISLWLRPLIFTPEQVPQIVDVELARTHPALAVLATLCHADKPEVDAIFPALAAALETLGPRTRSCTMTLCWPGCRRRPGPVGGIHDHHPQLRVPQRAVSRDRSPR